jgi:hypothetical protein
MMDAFFYRFDADNRQNGSKGLLPSYPHVRSDVVNKDRPDQISFSPPFLNVKVVNILSKSRL